ncbi:hypothetical protein MtrunA17_Chr8g0336231 [Medicago truncatula]|uniref:Uncharacterized protein n=1 Tax=Medicago truncatula TaxID=3880 RepID=A0A072TM88_MEDTR|nr:hypothetical protein MTR_8g007545 [Medicago truncatula]RHN38718.1 hypothetical protein MtrunA17_Chr8g0336231 [Medicago truncatula]
MLVPPLIITEKDLEQAAEILCHNLPVGNNILAKVVSCFLNNNAWQIIVYLFTLFGYNSVRLTCYLRG